MSRIKCIPFATEKDLKPRAKIHRIRIPWHPYVAKVAGAIASWNVHATAKRDGKMDEISANADPFFMTFRCRAVASCMVIPKLDPLMDIVANRLNKMPTAKTTEFPPG